MFDQRSGSDSRRMHLQILLLQLFRHLFRTRNPRIFFKHKPKIASFPSNCRLKLAPRASILRAPEGAALVQQLGRTPIDAGRGLPIYSLGPFPRCTKASDLRRSRDITVITTAALPWTTGPAINPLLRSVHLAREGHKVILLLPWLELQDQALLIYIYINRLYFFVLYYIYCCYNIYIYAPLLR